MNKIILILIFVLLFFFSIFYISNNYNIDFDLNFKSDIQNLNTTNNKTVNNSNQSYSINNNSYSNYNNSINKTNITYEDNLNVTDEYNSTIEENKVINDQAVEKQFNGKTIIVRTPENYVKPSSAKEHLDLFKEQGVTKIILLVKNDEDLDHMDSGEAFYDSSIAPIATDYIQFKLDALQYTIDYAKENNIEVYAWLPQFHDKALIEMNPDLQMRFLKNGNVEFYNEHGEYFVNPISEEVRRYQLSIIEEVISNYDIDGLYLDWIRFDDYNMDLSDLSREKFKESYGYDPVGIDFESDNTQRREWNDFREDQVAEYVEEVYELINGYDENMKIGIFILPVEMREVAQNPLKFENFVDEIGVMLYNEDWGYPEAWIYDKAVEDLKSMVEDDSKIIPVLDTFNCHKNELVDKILEKSVNYPYCFEYWDWTKSKLDYSFD